MKENRCDHCPCCGRHCRRDNLHCKHGVIYFSKLESKQQIKEPAHKWEKDLAPDGLARRFIRTGRGMKKRIARGKLSEENFLAALSAAEQITLDEILSHLEPLAQKGGQSHAR